MSSFAKNIDFNTLIPEMKDWNNGKGIDIDSWIQCTANHKILTGCARILWPDFVERDGCIFLASQESNYRGYLNAVNGDKRTAEATTNHVHILHLFGTELPSRELVLYVGRLLREIWEAKLDRDFPGRKIRVSFPEEDDLELIDYELTFFQEQ